MAPKKKPYSRRFMGLRRPTRRRFKKVMHDLVVATFRIKSLRKRVRDLRKVPVDMQLKADRAIDRDNDI
eukprot:6101964-Pyramimonas_sp.AAC.1